MAGLDDNAAPIEDWTPNASPRTLISNFLNEEVGTRSFSDLVENVSEAPAQESDKKKTITSSKEEYGGVGIHLSDDLSFKLNSFGVQKSSSHGRLTERMAERAGFNVPKLNTAHIRSTNGIPSPLEICSHYLTISHGLSPTTLLDSPVFLSNSMDQPSPTTGKFQFGQSNSTNSGLAFKPHLESRSLCFSSAENMGLSTIDHHQQLPNISVQSELPARAESIEPGPVNFQNQQKFNFQAGFSNSSERKHADDDITLNQRVSDSFMVNKQSLPLNDQPDGVADPKGESSSAATCISAEDGYNWRKYGQKQVKGSEYPRSYYKCTHLNCQVKKKVERSHEGHITEIIYKGTHNHLRPPQHLRSVVCHPVNVPQFHGSEHPNSQAGFDDKPLLANTQNGGAGHDWRSDGGEATSSASGAAEFCDPSRSMQTQDGPLFESPEVMDVSSTLSNDLEDEDDRATHASVSLGGDGEGDETESKKRKLEIEACAVEMSAASRAAREPRVVVQTTSEVDILDDGYRWRKYGQKVVKGNPNPRSYYKCTSPGCSVRKHVERASHDLKSVITTYEGKHNHVVPAARNSSSSHAGFLPSSATSTSVPQAHSLHRRPESDQATLMKFDVCRPTGGFVPTCGFGFGIPQQGLTSLGITGLSSMTSNDLKSVITTYEGNHNHDVSAARNSNSSYAGSLSSSTTSTSVPQTHGLQRRLEPDQETLMKFDVCRPTGGFGPSGGFGFGMPQQELTNLGITGISSMAAMRTPDLRPVYSFIGSHRRAARAGFMIEPKEESLSESGRPVSNGSSVHS